MFYHLSRGAIRCLFHRTVWSEQNTCLLNSVLCPPSTSIALSPLAAILIPSFSSQLHPICFGYGSPSSSSSIMILPHSQCSTSPTWTPRIQTEAFSSAHPPLSPSSVNSDSPSSCVSEDPSLCLNSQSSPACPPSSSCGLGSVPRSRWPGKAFVFAHRGFGCSSYGSPSMYPENSIASIGAAMEHGVDAVEIDVWLSKDSEVVVHHDAYLHRTAVLEDCSCERRIVQKCLKPMDSDGNLITETSDEKSSSTSLTGLAASESESDDSADVLSSGEQNLCVACTTRSLSIEDIKWRELQQRSPEGINFRWPWQRLKLAYATEGNKTGFNGTTSLSRGSSSWETSSTEDLEASQVPAAGETPEEISADAYFASREVYVGGDGVAEHVPTLREVLHMFHDKIKFNVELKGNKPELGLNVLKLCEEFPGTLLRISSFCWRPPPPQSMDVECGVHLEPNGPQTVDLLSPLVNNKLDIPLALLFNDRGNVVPSVDRIVDCLDKYGADWAHIHHQGHLPACQRFDPTQCVNNQSRTASVDSKEAAKQAGFTEEEEDDFRYDDLIRLVKSLNERNKHVMTFWGRGQDREVDIRRSIEAGVSAICPNDAPLAMSILSKYSACG
eukprot:GHVQ01031378.1.p1 GENE.GHVQ01031378.1~~GHVQ01031378.1.p1  ORF type:complete len:613 (+),score=93.65 GHVQ01031378.1:325-2163(+)